MSASHAYRRRRHVIRRAAERFGVAWTHADVAALERRLCRGDPAPFGRSRGSTLHRLEIGGAVVIVAFDPDAGQVRTVMPETFEARRPFERVEFAAGEGEADALPAPTALGRALNAALGVELEEVPG